MKRFSCIMALVLASCFLAAPSEAMSGNRYLFITMGRNMTGEGTGSPDCRLADGAVPLGDVVAYAASHGVKMGGNVIIDRTGETKRKCIARHVYATWAGIKKMHDLYGFEPQTSGVEYRPLAGLSPDAQRAEICGTRTPLLARGYTHFYGMYAAPYPPDRPAWDDSALAIARDCGFDKGRSYGAETFTYQPLRPDGTRIRTNVLTNLPPNHLMRSFSINAGSCPNWAPCTDGQNYTYITEGEILRDVRDAPANSLTILQWYRLVKGDGPLWHCTGPANQRWTYSVETGCWSTFKTVVDNVPGDYKSFNPQTVLEREGLV